MLRRIGVFLLGLAALAAAGVVVVLLRPELLLDGMNLAARRAAGLERKVIEVSGHRIAYLEGGSGPSVVLLHGFGASKDLWNAAAPPLAERYRVIARDVPGFGETPPLPGERYDAESQVARLRELFVALEIGPHHIGGSSMGGLLSAVYTLAYPEAVRSVMIGSAPGVRSPEPAAIDRALATGENPLLVTDEASFDALMGLVFFQPPAIPALLKRAAVRRAIASQDRNERLFADLARPGAATLEPRLREIEAPTLIVWGKADRLVHPSSVEVFAAGIPHAESTVIDACGHALPLECPDRLARRYLAFLDAQRPE